MATHDESDILEPKDPTISNDDWPEYDLSNVEVYDPSTGELTSLLRADEATPLTVIGKIEKIPHRYQHLVLDRKAVPTKLQLSGVEAYSYGQYDDGQPVVWAGGKAGWFTLRPSRQYRGIHKDMMEAINCLYFAADFYRDRMDGRRKKHRDNSVETLFKEFALDSANKCTTAKKATQRYLKHQEFLLDVMRRGKEGIKWPKAPIYDFLMSESTEPTSSIANGATSDEADEEEHGVGRGAGKGKGKTKSSLRPMNSNNFSTKGGKGQHLQSTNDGSFEGLGADEDGDIEMMEESLARSKRKLDDSHGSKSNKRVRTGGLSIDGARTVREQDEDAELLSTEENDEDEDEEEKPEARLPIRSLFPSTAHTDLPVPNITLKSVPLPSIAAQTDNSDVWHCSFDGCSHVVYNASAPLSRNLISEHWGQHAFDSQAQLDLVTSEERPYLPVGNLVRRIRELAAAEELRLAEASSEPVKRVPGAIERARIVRSNQASKARA